MIWNDFNSAEDQHAFEVIPSGTMVKVRMTIKPGGYDGPVTEWGGGYATESLTTGSIYLNCEFVVLEGEYAQRKVWSLIGLHSEKGPTWGNMGRTMIKGMLNSANRLMPDDQSPAAQQARRIEGVHVLDGIECVVQIGVQKDRDDEPRNTIKRIITPDYKDYAAVMNSLSQTVVPDPTVTQSISIQTPITQRANTPAVTHPQSLPEKPAWAQ